MDYVWYLFRFEGRINRARYWLAGFIILCWMMFLIALMAVTILVFDGTLPRTFGYSLDDAFRLLDPSSFHSLPTASPLAVQFKVVGALLFLWVYLATSIKRLHDRDRSGWWIFPFFIVPGLVGQFEDRFGDSIAATLPGLIAGAFYVWGGIEMYLLKGTRGQNRFGSDPLQPAKSRDAEHLTTPGNRRPGWDQHSELEFVPHSAGPSTGPHVNRGP
jgi:uncharacterized membrane protein YhaH (DUF805 family)